jgi:hypothetical protein
LAKGLARFVQLALDRFHHRPLQPRGRRTSPDLRLLEQSAYPLVLPALKLRQEQGQPMLWELHWRPAPMPPRRQEPRPLAPASFYNHPAPAHPARRLPWFSLLIFLLAHLSYSRQFFPLREDLLSVRGNTKECSLLPLRQAVRHPLRGLPKLEFLQPVLAHPLH